MLRLTVTFPVTEYRRHLANATLYWLVTGIYVFESHRLPTTYLCHSWKVYENEKYVHLWPITCQITAAI